MSGKPTIVLIGSYASEEGADNDFRALKSLHNEGIVGHLDGSIVTWHAGDELRVHHESHFLNDFSKAELADLTAILKPSVGTIALVVGLEAKDGETARETATNATTTILQRLDTQSGDNAMGEPEVELTHAEWMQAAGPGTGFEDGSVGHLGV
jgi:hypothetical protein